MGIKTKGFYETDEMLVIVEADVKKRVVRQLLKSAAKIQTLAIAMAPVDEEDLESAIKTRPENLEYQGRERNEAGVFVRTEIEVYIDADQARKDGKGTVGQYAYEIHEHLTPMGSLNLGEKSVLKQMNSPGILVGGGFLERAALEVEGKLDAEIMAQLDSLL